MFIAQVETLQRMPVFGGLADTALRHLLERACQRALPAGEAFFREGDDARSMFVLEAGRAAVGKRWQGAEQVLHELGPGDCFGEMALMDLQPRSASVWAMDDCRAIEFGHDDMLALFERDVEQFALLQMNLGREVCRRLRATDERLFRAAMGELPPRPLPLQLPG